MEGFSNPSESHNSEPRNMTLRQCKAEPRLRLGFFIYDERRRVFFSSCESDNRLFVQEASTGHSLVPIIDADMQVENYRVLGAALSEDGIFLGVLYYNISGLLCTLIWQIKEHLSFKKRMKPEPWAKKHFILRPGAGEPCLPLDYFPSQIASNRIVFGKDSCFYSPNGKAHPQRGDMRSFSDIIQERSWTIESSAVFSGDGSTLVLNDHNSRSLERLSTVDSRPSEEIEYEKSSDDCFITVSLTGRYLVIVDGFLNLYDTISKKTFQLEYDYLFGLPYCQFSKDETKLFDLAGAEGTYLIVWGSLTTEPCILSQGDLNGSRYDTTKIEPQRDMIYILQNDVEAWAVRKENYQKSR